MEHFSENFLEVWISCIQVFNKLETKQLGLKSGQKNVPSGQGISYHVFLTLLVLDYIRKGLNELDPTCMPFVQLLLALKMFQRLVIRMNYELLRPKVVLSRLKGPDQRIQFLVISGIVECGSSKLLTEVSNGFPILHQDSTNPNSGSITFNLKGFRKIRKYK